MQIKYIGKEAAENEKRGQVENDVKCEQTVIRRVGLIQVLGMNII